MEDTRGGCARRQVGGYRDRRPGTNGIKRGIRDVHRVGAPGKDDVLLGEVMSRVGEMPELLVGADGTVSINAG